MCWERIRVRTCSFKKLSATERIIRDKLSTSVRIFFFSCGLSICCFSFIHMNLISISDCVFNFHTCVDEKIDLFSLCCVVLRLGWRQCDIRDWEVNSFCLKSIITTFALNFIVRKFFCSLMKPNNRKCFLYQSAICQCSCYFFSTL